MVVFVGHSLFGLNWKNQNQLVHTNAYTKTPIKPKPDEGKHKTMNETLVMKVQKPPLVTPVIVVFGFEQLRDILFL